MGGRLIWNLVIGIRKEEVEEAEEGEIGTEVDRDLGREIGIMIDTTTAIAIPETIITTVTETDPAPETDLIEMIDEVLLETITAPKETTIVDVQEPLIEIPETLTEVKILVEIAEIIIAGIIIGITEIIETIEIIPVKLQVTLMHLVIYLDTWVRLETEVMRIGGETREDELIGLNLL